MTPEEADGIADQAAVWLAREDRGLSAEEQADLAAWLAADPRHGEELARMRGAWNISDRVKESPELQRLAAEVGSPATRPRIPFAAARPKRAPYVLAALAAAVLVFGLWRLTRREIPPAVLAPAPYRLVPASSRTMTLSDGSVVELRSGGDFAAEYSAAERRVVLRDGEAHFAVAHNTARPFIVGLGPVAVRAVGTAFDIRRAPSEIDVLVTAGKVAVDDGRGPAFPPAVPLLVAGQRATIPLDGNGRMGQIAVDTPAPPDVERRLAWRSAWLVFDRTPLASAVAAFNREGAQRLVLGDASLAERRLGGTFRADNVEGFVRLLRDSLDVKSERRPDGEILLLPESPPR